MSRKQLSLSAQWKNDSKKQTSLAQFITKKDKLATEESSNCNVSSIAFTSSLQSERFKENLQSRSVTASDEEAKLRSPSIFKPKFPKSKQLNTVEILSSDSDSSPVKSTGKVSRKLQDAYPLAGVCSSKKELDSEHADEYDLLVSQACSEATAVSLKLELDLENDAHYQQATRKLEENLAKISPLKDTGTRKIGKFEYKVPKAASMLSALNEPLKKPINLNETPPVDDDLFAAKRCKPSSSTPINSSGSAFKPRYPVSNRETANVNPINKTGAVTPAEVNSNLFKPTLTKIERVSNIQNDHAAGKIAAQVAPIEMKTDSISSSKPTKSFVPKQPISNATKSIPETIEKPGSTSTTLDRLLSPTKHTPIVRFDPDLNNYMVDILNSSRFKSQERSEMEIRRNCQYLQETNQVLLGKFYEILAQLPIEFFSSVQGFQMDTYSKLKSLIENTRGKIRVNERALDNLKNMKKTSTIGSRKSHIDASNEQNSLDAVFAEEVVNNGKVNSFSNSVAIEDFENDFVDNTLPPEKSNDLPVQPKAGAFVFKKPISGTPLNSSERELDSMIENKDSSREDDEDDIETILKNIREAELIDKGRANQQNLSSIDLVTPESSFRRPESRITFSAQETSLRDTQFIENVETQVDDDGWQVYDPSQFEEPDVISIADASEGLVNASTYQRKESRSDDTLCRLLDGTCSQTSTTSNNQRPNSKNSMGNFHSGVRNDGITGEFDRTNYSHSEQMQFVFRETFGLRSFRPNQLQVINATLLGKDCFVLMPTGGGKSLCYQLPALLTEGVTIVVSPLKSLILDQVNKLNSLDIPAAALSGEVSYAEQEKIYSDLQRPNPVLKLLYVTPEKISASARFQNVLTGLFKMKRLGRFIIDEAHCVSAWGHDFRPDYKKLSILREQFPKVPIMALTATANPRVRIDVLKQLKLVPETKWFLCSFNRPNLKYIIRPKQGAATKTEIIELIKKKFPRASGIVYCLSKKDCDQLAAELKSAGIKAKSYHAGLSDKLRESTQKDWITDKTKVVCATIAFGMGIDKPDVRYVIHHSMPKSIEGYYQEAGRAGRDGEIATCVLFYSYSDMLRYRKMMDHDNSIPFEAKQVHLHNLFRMVNYCENVTDCRRTQQLDYFAEHFTREQCLENRATACDNCLMQGEYKTVDVTDDCIAIAKCVRDLCSGRNRFTLLHLVDIFKGSEHKKILENNHNRTPYHGRLKSWDRNDIQRLMHKLVIEDYLKEDLIFCNDIPQAYLKIGSKIEKLMNREVRVSFSVKEKTTGKKVQQIDVGNEPKLGSQSNAQLKELQERCYNDLLDICRTLAAEKNVTLASVMNMQALKAMSERLPETQAEMLSLPHVTKANFEKYGQQLLEITQNYAAEKLCLMLDAEATDGANEADEDSDSDSSNDGTDWGRLAREASAASSTGGTKRRRSWGTGGRGAKRFRKGRAKSKTARAKAGSSRGGVAGKRGGSKFGASSSRGARAGTSGFGLLPLPGSR